MLDLTTSDSVVVSLPSVRVGEQLGCLGRPVLLHHRGGAAHIDGARGQHKGPGPENGQVPPLSVQGKVSDGDHGT